MAKRKIVTLCGSTKFKEDFLKAAAWKTLIGEIVLMPGVFSQADNTIIPNETKKELDRLHKDKIYMSDEIYVINKNGYIGESTKSEIEYAKSLGKFISYLEPKE